MFTGECFSFNFGFIGVVPAINKMKPHHVSFSAYFIAMGTGCRFFVGVICYEIVGTGNNSIRSHTAPIFSF
jgi:hypothetical protein